MPNFGRSQLDYAIRQRRLLDQQLADDDGADRLRNFFVAAWHIGDHASQDLDEPSRGQFKVCFNSNRVLCIVADVANRTKHVQLTRSDRLGAEVTIKHIHARDGADVRPATATYTITLADGSKHDALEVADQCIGEWTSALAAFGI